MTTLLSYINNIINFVKTLSLEWYKNASSNLTWINSNEVASFLFYTYVKLFLFMQVVGVLIFIFFPEKIVRRSNTANFSDTVQSAFMEFFKTALFPVECIYLRVKNKNPLLLRIVFFFIWCLLFLFFLFLDPITRINQNGFFFFIIEPVLKFFTSILKFFF